MTSFTEPETFTEDPSRAGPSHPTTSMGNSEQSLLLWAASVFTGTDLLQSQHPVSEQGQA